MLLAAVGLSFRHPWSGAEMHLAAPPAADFLDVTQRLGWGGLPELNDA